MRFYESMLTSSDTWGSEEAINSPVARRQKQLDGTYHAHTQKPTDMDSEWCSTV